MAQLIITEKPSVSEKIAEALSDKKPHKQVYQRKVPFYEIEHNGEKIIIVCAVGHLFTVAEKDKQGWKYPTFKVEWVPTYEAQKYASFTKDYLNAIKKLSKGADSFIVACDWDVEGEVIGFNILHFICKKDDASRMTYSTTTKEDLLESFENKQPHLDKGLVNSGLSRHVLDWLWGVNLSRALTLSIKNSTGMFKILSSGRVQGPALKILAEREKEIQAFKPVPFWQLELLAKNGLVAWHKEDKFWEKKKATDALKRAKGEKAKVEKVERKEAEQKPPHPFDLTALQLEAYKKLNLSPKETLDLAQELYTASYISYPRTSSNQLPPKIDFKKILNALKRQERYKVLAEELSGKSQLAPNNGPKKDPAHPAIFPTGVVPGKIRDNARKLYDLIVHRFLATFGDSAVRETLNINLNVGDETFIAKGVRTVKPGWHKLYGKYAKFKEEELPAVKEGELLDVEHVKVHDEETQPPKRFTPASIIKELEKKDLGTKATRSEIIEALYQRDYVKEKAIEVTQLGVKIIETLDKFCPEILDEELTRHFEQEMGQIQEGKKKKEEVLEEAESVLKKILDHFKLNEKKIGKALSEAYKETRDQASIVGKCSICNNDLKILYSRKNRSYFVACSGYPDCKNTFSLPQGAPKPTGKVCEECKFPLVMIIRKGRRPFEYCINKSCPKKVEWIKKQEEKNNKKAKEEF